MNRTSTLIMLLTCLAIAPAKANAMLSLSTIKILPSQKILYAQASESERETHKELENLTKAIKKNPNDIDAYYMRAGHYININQFNKALSEYNHVIKLEPNNPIHYEYRGQLYANELKQYDKALADYNQALKLTTDPLSRKILFEQRGDIYSDALKQYDKAISDYNQAINLCADCGDLYLKRSSSYVKLKQYDKAIADYNKLLKLNQSHVSKSLIYLNRGNAYFELHNYEQAISDYNQSSKDYGDYKVEALVQRGKVYNHLGEYNKAIIDFNQAIEDLTLSAHADIKKESIYYNRGLVYRSLGSYPKAISDYNQAIKIKPNYADAYSGLGVVYLDLKHNEKALVNLRKAQELYFKQGSKKKAQDLQNIINKLSS